METDKGHITVYEISTKTESLTNKLKTATTMQSSHTERGTYKVESFTFIFEVNICVKVARGQ